MTLNQPDVINHQIINKIGNANVGGWWSPCQGKPQFDLWSHMSNGKSTKFHHQAQCNFASGCHSFNSSKVAPPHCQQLLRSGVEDLRGERLQATFATNEMTDFLNGGHEKTKVLLLTPFLFL